MDTCISTNDVIQHWFTSYDSAYENTLQLFYQRLPRFVKEGLTFDTNDGKKLLVFPIMSSYHMERPIFAIEIDESTNTYKSGIVCRRNFPKESTPMEAKERKQMARFKQSMFEFMTNKLQSSTKDATAPLDFSLVLCLTEINNTLPKMFDNALQEKCIERVDRMASQHSRVRYTEWREHVAKLPVTTQKTLYAQIPIFDEPYRLAQNMWMLLAQAYVRQEQNSIAKIPSPWHINIDQSMTYLLMHKDGVKTLKKDCDDDLCFVEMEFADKPVMQPHVSFILGPNKIQNIPDYINDCLNGVFGYKEDMSLQSFFENTAYTSPQDIPSFLQTWLLHDREWEITVKEIHQIHKDITEDTENVSPFVEHLPPSIFCSAWPKYLEKYYGIHRTVSELDIPEQEGLDP